MAGDGWRADVVVLGAGPAGLAAAWWLARAGRSVVVVERSERVGGLAASIEVAGQRVDLGSHRLHGSIDPAVLDDIRRLPGVELQLRPRHGRIRLAGRWVRFPLRAVDLVRSLPPKMTAGAALDAVAAPLRRPRADTFAEEVRAGLGPTVARAFHEPYAAKLWGVPADHLDGELARRRIGVRSPGAVLDRLRPSAPRTFLYPSRGFGAIAEGLATVGRDAGVDLRLGTSPRSVRADGGSVTVALDDGEVVTAGTVLSTIPVTSLVRILDPVPTSAVSVADSLRHRAMALVYLVVDRDRYTPFDAHYLPEPATIMSRLSEPKAYRHGPDPAGRSVLCAEVPCWAHERDPVWGVDDGELAARVASELTALGLPPPSPVGHRVVRLPHVYPVYEQGTSVRLEAVEDAVEAVPGLVTLGRQGLFVADNTHHVLAMAREAAGCVGPGGTFDRGRWRAAREAFRSHVVED